MPFSIKAGLDALEPYVQPEATDTWNEFQNYKGQLHENLRRERLFGITPALQAERNAITYQLNPFARELTGVSFADLCEGRAPTKPRPDPRPHVQPAPRVLTTGDEAGEKLVDILARQASSSPIDPKQYYRNLVLRTDLPEKWKQELGGWTGNTRADALTLLNYALGKRTHPTSKRYTPLGSVLRVLLRDDLGFEDATTVAAIIVAYRLYRTENELNNLAMRFQVPREADPLVGQPELGPEIQWLGPTDELELQGFFTRPPDLQDVGFLKRAVEQAASVCKVELSSLNRIGTGFLLADDLVLTNYHVLKYAPGENIDANASNVVLRFAYFTAEGGHDTNGREFKLADNPIVHRSPVGALDYVLLRVEEAILDAQDIRPLHNFALDPPLTGAGLHILQHPEGATMKLATSSNGVTSVDRNNGILQYITRALGGSSGSPCFDDDWRLVALHHAQRSRTFGSIREGILFAHIYQQIQQYLVA